MEYIIKKKKFFPKKEYFNNFLKKFWYVPSDVLQRSLEASIWDLCRFKHPILDIGIGNGEIDLIIFKNIKKIDVGIDIETEGLINARLTKKYNKVLREDASKMSFNNSTFNSVITNSTFEHIENDTRAISEVSRVLKKGGLFYMTVPNKNLSKWILDFENNSKDKLQKFNKRANHLHYRTQGEWAKIFEKNGMEILFSKYYFEKNVSLFWYRAFKFFTFEIRGKELWSYFKSSRYFKLIPSTIYMKVVRAFTQSKFDKGFFTLKDGGMSFFIARKI